MPKKIPEPKRVTIKSVAADAGVSVSAVSKVLRDAYGVSSQLRERVNASMVKLGYRPSVAARGMRGKSYTIGVLMADTRNAFYADLLEGINAAFHTTQYQALIGINQHETDIESNLVNAMIDRQMDGIIMIGPRQQSRPEEQATANPANLSDIANRIPTVIVGCYDDSPQLDTVNNDDVLGAHLAVNHLVEQGYKRITFINSELNGGHRLNVASHRHQGYLEAMEENGLGRYISIALAREVKHSIRNSVHELFAAKSRPEALFCWSDVVAFEVISAVQSLGYSIPDDVGIVGYDNTRACDYWQNSLTSIDQAGQALGLQAARLLLERINGRTEPEQFILPPRLVVRRSSIHQPSK